MDASQFWQRRVGVAARQPRAATCEPEVGGAGRGRGQELAPDRCRGVEHGRRRIRCAAPKKGQARLGQRQALSYASTVLAARIVGLPGHCRSLGQPLLGLRTEPVRHQNQPNRALGAKAPRSAFSPLADEGQAGCNVARGRQASAIDHCCVDARGVGGMLGVQLDKELARTDGATVGHAQKPLRPTQTGGWVRCPPLATRRPGYPAARCWTSSSRHAPELRLLAAGCLPSP